MFKETSQSFFKQITVIIIQIIQFNLFEILIAKVNQRS